MWGIGIHPRPWLSKHKLDNLEVTKPSSWPYTIPVVEEAFESFDDWKRNKPSSESRFNLNHGFMWGVLK